MKSYLIKTLTLCLFLSGIGLFVLHQSGYFANAATNYQGSHNGGALTGKPTDSLAQKKADSVLRFISSSKVAIPVTAQMRAQFDSVDKANAAPKPLPKFIGSSKVIIIQDRAKISDPAIQADTIKPFKNTKKQ